MSAWILLRGLTPRNAALGHAAGEAARRDERRDERRAGAVDRSAGQRRICEAALLHERRGHGWLRAARRAGKRVPGPYRLLAMSLGGMVATDWAQRHPQEIERLVLINTSMRPFSRPRERLRPQAWTALLRLAVHWARCAGRRDGDSPVDVQQPPDACRRYRRVERRFAAARRSAAPTHCVSYWQRRRSPRATRCRAAPPLILSSREDGLVNPTCSASLAAAWSAPHRQHEWAGHDLPHDDPTWTVEQVQAWLRLESGAASR